MTKLLLLISSRREDQEFSVAVAMTSGLTLRTISNLKQAVDFISQNETAVIFVEASSAAQYQAFETAVQETVGIFSDKINSNSIHFLSQCDLYEAPYLALSPLFGHFISSNFKNPKSDGAHYGRVVKATLNERTFGLKEILGSEVKIQVAKLNASTQKQDAVEAVKNFLLTAKFQARVATVIANAVDELLMNAIFDAPIDEVGKSIHNSTPRTAHIDLQGESEVEMHLGFDGHYVAISAIDHYGSLDKKKLLTHISKIYNLEQYKVKTTTAGAGIGLANVLNSGGSFLFVSDIHSRTEVTVFFKKTDSFREFKNQFRFVSTQFYF